MDLRKASENYKQELTALHDKHGGWFHRIPLDEQHVVAERLRAAYVIDIVERDGLKDMPSVLQSYNIDRRVIEEILGFVPEVEPKEKRSDKMSDFFTTVASMAGEEKTTAEIADLGGFSDQTARKVINDRPDLFHKAGRGRWMLRNPDEDRAAEAAELEGKKK